MSLRHWLRAGLLPLLAGLLLANAHAQMVTGDKMPGYGETFKLAKEQLATHYTAQLISCSAPGHILWPDEQASFTFQVVNTTDQPLVVDGQVELIAYGTRGQPGDIWVPEVFKIADLTPTPVHVDLKPKGYQNLTITPTTPATFAGYMLVLDLGAHGRRFVAGYVRTFKANPGEVLYPQVASDVTDVDVLTRLGSFPNRIGTGYKITTDTDFPKWLADFGAKLDAYKQAKLPITLEIGGGSFYGPEQPLNRPRPWLDDQGVQLDTKFDLAWLPGYDEDFRKFVTLLVTRYGWPKGPITSIKLWNEPWNGISIAGWGADDERYREIFRVMCEATTAANESAGVTVLLGGCDSSSNTLDKLFADGSSDWLKYLDFCSIHYQGMQPPSTIKDWVNRPGPRGRVRIWDTESWVANTDDRVAAVVATNLSTGHDRAVGIYPGNICTEWHSTAATIIGDDGKGQRINMVHAWSVAAAVGAVNHFIGERRFRELLFKNGLPWIMVFDGLPGPDGKPQVDDGTVVIVGDIGEEFGADNVLFRTARGLNEPAWKADMAKQLAALPADAEPKVRKKLEAALANPKPLSGGALIVPASTQFHCGLYDFYGNPVAPVNGEYRIPLDHRGFYLRADTQPGGFKNLLATLRAAHVSGIEPLAKACHDLTAPIASQPTLRLTLTNVLNRPVKGSLTVTLGELTLDVPATVSFAANETKDVLIKVTGGTAVPSNTYPLYLTFDAGDDGRSEHREDLHVNCIAKRTITVDGKLADWEGVLPQGINASGDATPTVTEAAWFPFKPFDATIKPGFATGYLAYDADYFYFAAKIADDSPDPGMMRMATRNDDVFFYPPVSYLKELEKPDKPATDFSARWTGELLAPVTGEYTLSAHVAGTARLWLNDQPVFDSGGRGNDIGGKVTLTAGQRYPIKLEYAQAGGDSAMTFIWQPPQVAPRVVVPTANLFPDAAVTGAGTGLHAAYFKGTKLAGTPLQERLEAKVDYPRFIGQPADADFRAARDIKTALTWPNTVRRFSYRRDPELPAGNAPRHDNVQLAFNVLPAEQKPLLPCPPGTMPGYIIYSDTDYEYALNPIAPAYGSGTEIWRLRYPGMPHKHFYPREPKSPLDGAVKDGKLVITRDPTTRLVEAAIPWAEIPGVKAQLDAGAPIKFSFRVNDNGNPACMELSRQRSVAKRNGSFMVDWAEHWANELEFGWEK